MGYFQELPDLLYQSNLITKTSSQEYLRVKNLFRKVKLTDQVKEAATFFQKYVIEQGDRPDVCLLYTSPSPRDGLLSRMPSSA